MSVRAGRHRLTSYFPVVLSLALLGACGKPSGKGDPSPVAVPSASAGPSTQREGGVGTSAPTAAAKPASRRSCHRGEPVTVSEGRGGITHAVAASATGVVVTWGELRPASAGFGPEGGKQRTELARVFDADTLAARGPGKVVGQQEAVDAFSNGVAPFALADGTLGTGTCAWAAFAGRFTCRLAPASPIPPGTFSGADYDDRGVPGPGPQGDRLAVTAVGDAAILIAPQCQDVRIFASAGKPGLRPLAYGTADARTECEAKRTIDAPAIAAIGSDEAFGVWRHGAVIEGRRVGKDGLPRGPLVTVSAAGGDVGAPAVAWTGSEARVAYGARTGVAPYALAFAHWKPDGAAATRAAVATGNTPAMAPALAPTDDPACTVISWTEGKGIGTRVRAGLACDDALVAGSVVDLSTFATEAGDSELARLGPSGAYVVWQELPKGKPAELLLAKLICE